MASRNVSVPWVPLTELAVFVGVAAVVSTAWYFVNIHVFDHVDLRFVEAIAAWSVACVFPAWYVNRWAPARTIDRFHSLGVYFAMFIVINTFLTAGFFIIGLLMYRFSLAPDSTLLIIVVSSLWLPGPYAGAVAGRWWSQW